jgi:hypothetical protein
MIATKRALLVAILAVVVGCGGTGASTPSQADTCLTISTDYATAREKAKECTLGTANPCTKTVIASFYCQCHILVSGDTAPLAAIEARFTAAGCPSMCTGACAMETAASCQTDPTSSTGGRCLPAQPGGGP